jgi:hypothetical protein
MPRRRPRLNLALDASGGDAVVVGTAGGTESAYVRLRVTNASGKDTADDVQVLVVERRLLDGSETTPIALPLIWSGSYPPATAAPVHPGAERYLDLLHVDWPGRDELEIAERWTGSEDAFIEVMPKPAGRQDRLVAGEYTLRLQLLARNADATWYEVVVHWDGKWSGKADMWTHLRVEQPRKLDES